jgi:GR25 family glycosyltransferase involved in LPS biosynthesis
MPSKTRSNIGKKRGTTRKNTATSDVKRSDALPNIVSVHVVNLDKDSDRWRTMKKSLKNVKPVANRWPAIYGKDLLRTDMHRLGVGFNMVHSGKGEYSKQHKNLRNLGAVGCFLSHRNLMSHLSFTNVPESAGHLILEDDAEIPPHFLTKGGEWLEKRGEIPEDWDIIYMGINKPIGKHVSANVMKLTHAIQDEGNWGTHAYIVRHGSLKTKILPWLKYMIDSIDLQFNIKFDEWNVYAFAPSIVHLGEAAKKSTIQTM